MSVDSMLAITANSEEEARKEANQRFVEMLQRGEAELVVVDEWSDDSYSQQMQNELERIDE
tara:strand:- start:35 stop:217 length:183 start_codon:yes stop_codon:yes gene_type:complete